MNNPEHQESAAWRVDASRLSNPRTDVTRDAPEVFVASRNSSGTGYRFTSAVIRVFLAMVLMVGSAAIAPSGHAHASTVWYVDTATRSDAEIRAKWQELRPRHTGPQFTVEPSTSSPFATGAVHPGFLADGLAAINFTRYLAGLPHDVVLDPARVNEAQHGAVLLAASNFSHTPDQPAGMCDDFYSIGYSSTSSSNVGRGHRCLVSFQTACVADSSSASNLRILGHRRWLLNPPMKVTGIGYADRFSTTYVRDRSRAERVEFSAITWPSAGPFPVEQFDPKTPWSISLNPERFDFDPTGHTVTLRRIADNRTWTFNASQTDTNRQFFHADFGGYGIRNSFSFRPDPAQISYAPGDEFEVTLAGGVFNKGTRVPATVQYRTRFMSLDAPAVSDPTTFVPIQHDAGGVVFDRWVTGRNAAYSGGGYVYSRWSGVSLEARFTGSRVRVIGPRQPNYGKAEIYLDGNPVPVATIDAYAPPGSQTTSAVLWESAVLPEGAHKITIRVLGERNPQSTGEIVVLDRFEVAGQGAGPVATRVFESGPQGYYTGNWIRGRNNAYLGGGYQYSRWSGSAYRATFTGTRVAWIGPRTPQYGRVQIFINGKLQGTVCQYGPTGWRYRVWESPVLPRGTHTLEIRVTGTKSAASSSTNVVIDALDITP